MTSQRPEVGDRVTGTYFGVPYTGTVRISRPHTINYRIWITHVDTDEPITVYGRERSGFAIESKAAPGETDADGSRIEILEIA